MPDSGDLFDPGPAPGAAPPATPARVSTPPPRNASLVTNHPNLMYMLAAGALMPPAGFGGKYYRDPLASFPGWLPLFVGEVPAPAIGLAIEEARHLKPVIARVRLSDLSGTVSALGPDGLRAIRFPEGLDGAEKVLLVPAPLPASWIESIVFPSTDDRKAFEEAAGDFGNVPVRDFQRKTSKRPFTRAPDDPWPPAQGPVERDTPLAVPFAAGGVMAMLLHFAHRGDLAVHASRQAFDPDDDPAPLAGDPVLAGLSPWMRAGAASPPPLPDTATDREHLRNIFQARLFWGFVERLSGREPDGGGSAEDLLLDYIEEASATLDTRLGPGATKLRETLRSLTGLGGATAGELFERHTSALGRAMILFCLRRDCADLLDFSHGALREPDWLAAAILLGARDGWLGLPLDLRAVPGVASGTLAAAVSHRTARMAHRMAGTDLDLGPSPSRIRPLRELFGAHAPWRSRENDVAGEIARTQKWDCVRTRVSLGRGSYRLTVEGGSVHIDLSGEARVTTTVDRARFLEHLAEARPTPRAEAKARKALDG